MIISKYEKGSVSLILSKEAKGYKLVYAYGQEKDTLIVLDYMVACGMFTNFAFFNNKL